MAAICLVLLFSGCVEKEAQENKVAEGQTGDRSAPSTAEKLTVIIDSPRAGEILQGRGEVAFEATIKGGKGPYAFSWSSNIDGELSTSKSFRYSPEKLSKGGQVIILKVTDASGNVGQGSVQVEVM